MPTTHSPDPSAGARREVVEILVNAREDALDESTWVIPHAVYFDAQTKEFIGGYSPMEDECPQALSHIFVAQRHFVYSY